MADPITVDFEGFAKGRPLLAGVLVEREFRQFAFTDVEPGIAMAARACGLQCTDFEGFCIALVVFARLKGIAIPADYHDRQVTTVLRRVLVQSANHTRFRGLTRSTRDAWRSVLKHNRCDCVWARSFIRSRSSGRPRDRSGCRRSH